MKLTDGLPRCLADLLWLRVRAPIRQACAERSERWFRVKNGLGSIINYNDALYQLRER